MRLPPHCCLALMHSKEGPLRCCDSLVEYLLEPPSHCARQTSYTLCSRASRYITFRYFLLFSARFLRVAYTFPMKDIAYDRHPLRQDRGPYYPWRLVCRLFFCEGPSSACLNLKINRKLSAAFPLPPGSLISASTRRLPLQL